MLSFDIGDRFMAHNGFNFVIGNPTKARGATVGGVLGKNVPFEILSQTQHNGTDWVCVEAKSVGRVWVTEPDMRRATQALHADAPGVGLEA